MTVPLQMKRILCAGLTALACAAALGCGEDEPASDPAPAPAAEATTATSPAPTTTQPAEEPPASGAAKLTAQQRTALLAANNEIALGDDPPSVTGPKVAANYRDYAKPLRAGPCKRALAGSAETWEQLAKADADGDAALEKKLGQRALEDSSAVFNSC